ncbi:unnamed protein product [Sphenostylis stenocarpa]|uniref:Uncharacterized protein n=1 Tax=Sphenostylis stenocarpa TaxID=92480 RepID=A0AA86STQ4_9FABA|nr:unnamed protein product [Sphenostylis stenocarpa]
MKKTTTLCLVEEGDALHTEERDMSHERHPEEREALCEGEKSIAKEREEYNAWHEDEFDEDKCIEEEVEAEALTEALTKYFGLLQWKKGMEVGTLEWKGLQRPVKDLGMVGEGEREWWSEGNMGLEEKRVVALAEAIWGLRKNRRSKDAEQGLWYGVAMNIEE